ncbi:MAG: hypothetical protein ACTHMV_18070 [Chitinophagaceae bacterium]
MKNLLSNTRIAAVALVLSLTLVFATAAQANETNPTGVELRFIGNLKNQPVFHLSYNGAVENEYTIVVRDEYNNVLYKDYVKGTNISKKFMLNTDELGDVDVTFEITDRKAGKPVVYEISKNSRLIQDVVVNKLK